jgi:hypothetical protein
LDSSLLSILAMYSILQISILGVKWIETKMRPTLLRMGVLSENMEALHETSKRYHEMGIVVPHILLVKPAVISREAERWPRIRLTLEALTLMVGISVSTGFLLIT